MPQFVVCEPFPSRTSQVSLVFVRVSGNEKLTLRSLMTENGVIFSDGIEIDYLGVPSDIEVKIGMAERGCRLLV